ncbi:MAG: bifunctional phosphopantothenoylcysteine decarboxylase/phosphopantothenate--cysteine ligase CoaBC [Chloroflexota bacterium]|nr:bifunctional phosphopantothenoylcysteine decarboxylase/phosphopantothenate--cysteine ligase CoaBC [Dehalococcoidia bacterium]MDW8252699.1 bifunctional phosphopantothenoylcysteine decarboxylase/phosphopantothenate--cysteine ligase CoaBC [Chloroflexota bacterium]
MSALRGRRVLLAVCGSIAAYKAVQLASDLVKAGALVDTILTEGALQFVQPLSFRALTHRLVVTTLWDPHHPSGVLHVDLATAAEALLVAPATADTIARLALGLADDLLGCVALSTTAPLVLAPAMESHMFLHPATQQHLTALRERGAFIIAPDVGRLASGASGIGRMAEPAAILGHLAAVLGRNGDLAGRHIVVTAGGTREPIDPVRYLSNRSTGKQGYAIAEAARDRGARVTLVTSASLPPPPAVTVVAVERAEEMLEAVAAACRDADALIMAAAVADYRVAAPASEKIKKGADRLTLELVKNPDILASVRGDFIRVGFAAETEQLLAHAEEKLRAKALDLIVANDVSAPDAGFAVDTNRVVLVSPEGAEALPLLSKREVADRILDRVVARLRARRA